MDNIFDFDIDRITQNLITTARIYECDFIEAWDLYTPREIKTKTSIEEVLKHLKTKGFSL